MLNMCKYNMASQQDSNKQSIYSLGSEEPDITNMGLMTQHSEHTSNKRKHNMSEYRHLQMKKAEEPDYLQHSSKIVAEVQATCRSPSGTTSETSILSAKHKLSKHEYKGTQQDLHQILSYMHLYQEGKVGFSCSKPALTQWLSYSTIAGNSFEVAHTSPLSTTQYTTMDSFPSPYEKAIHSTHTCLEYFRVSTSSCLCTT